QRREIGMAGAAPHKSGGFRHQGASRKASNLQRLLLDALDLHDSSLTAYQRAGVNIAPHLDQYDPHAAATAGRRLAAEYELSHAKLTHSFRAGISPRLVLC
ncbi:MAG TPA: hypothetical protein VHG27_08440, partial [Xanthobacteraceae bacterium]|nr:hypothetical protein [Xanthobacteraceae bacterium]